MVKACDNSMGIRKSKVWRVKIIRKKLEMKEMIQMRNFLEEGLL